MGKRTASALDEAKGVLAGTLTGTGTSGNAVNGLGATIAPCFFGQFNFTLSGIFTATVEIDRSLDGGATWVVCSKDTSGTAASYTAPVTVIMNEPELGVIYRVNCTAFTSGTVAYRVSQ